MEQLAVEQDGLQPDLHAHGSDEQLELYVLGRLPESQTALLEEHLMVCDSCRDNLNGISEFVLGMRQAVNQKPEALLSHLASFFRRPAVSMALTFALFVILMAVLSPRRTQIPPNAALQLTATRGTMPLTIPARSLILRFTDPPAQGGPFRVEVFNAAGNGLWTGFVSTGRSGIEVNMTTAQPLAPGDYFVRFYSADGKTLREYGFRVRS